MAVDLHSEAEKLMRLEGKTKGSEFLTLSRYIEKKYGKEGVKRLEDRMGELGCPCRFSEFRPSLWYKEGLNVLAMLVAKDLFGWHDLYDFGYNSPVFSFGVEVFMKFASPNLFCSQIPRFWSKFMDYGRLEFCELNWDLKKVVLRLHDYAVHPEMCRYYQGFFLRITEYMIRSKRITVEETKCMYRGDPYHEYLVRWE